MVKDLLNKTVMIRTYSAGVHYGILEKCENGEDSYNVKLKDATRVYSWSGAYSLSQLAVEGTLNDNTNLSVKVPSILLKAIEIIEMTPLAIDRLSNLKVWKIENSVTEEISN